MGQQWPLERSYSSCPSQGKGGVQQRPTWLKRGNKGKCLHVQRIKWWEGRKAREGRKQQSRFPPQEGHEVRMAIREDSRFSTSLAQGMAQSDTFWCHFLLRWFSLLSHYPYPLPSRGPTLSHSGAPKRHFPTSSSLLHSLWRPRWEVCGGKSKLQRTQGELAWELCCLLHGSWII